MNLSKKILIFSILNLTYLFSQVWTDGSCYLEDSIDHSGTTVIFQAVSPGALSDTTSTSVEGLYQLNISQGIYNILFEHDGYFTSILEGVNCFNPSPLSNTTLIIEPTGTYISGNISGLLADSVYIVEETITITDTVHISAGSIFYMSEAARINIEGGALFAIGTLEDSIKFIPNRNSENWDGIWNWSGYLELEYCSVNGLENEAVTINSAISSRLNNCVISDCRIALVIEQGSNPYIGNCHIYDCSTESILCHEFSNPTIENCSIINSGIISISNSSPLLVNTLVYSTFQFQNVIDINDSSPTINFCNIYGVVVGNSIPATMGELVTTNTNGDSCDAYYNIFMDPLITDDLLLSWNSPAIDAGDPNSPLDPDTTLADIGAFYHPQGPRSEISVIQIELDYSETVVGQDSIANVVIQNIGDLDLIIYSIQADDSSFIVAWNPIDSIIPSQSTLSISVSFNPTSYFQYSSTLHIQSNDHPVVIPLSGIGVPPQGDYVTSLIVTGGGIDSLNWNYYFNNTSPSTNDAFTKLAYGRYYGESRLQYLNPIGWQDLDGDGLDDGIIDDTILNPESFQLALENTYDSPDTEFPNVIFMAGHGHIGEFDINGDQEDNIDIDTLAIWIDEANLDLQSPLVVVFEACFSGTYIEPLAGANRVIISAANGEQFADYLNGESFSTHFWHEIWYGNNLWDSFSFAYDWANANLNGQEPMLDADGNGVPNEATDQAIAEHIFLGGQYMHGAGLPKITEYPTSVELNQGSVSVDVACNGNMDVVWFTIYPEDYNGDPSVDELPRVYMTHTGSGNYTGTYIDDGFIALDQNYELKVEAVNDIWNFAVPRFVTLDIVSLDVDKLTSIPNQFRLEQNYPNPFNPTTTISYGLPEESTISLVIYDLRGAEVQTLESGVKPGGWYDIAWNGKTADGKTISTGIYFARLVAGDYSQVIKMLYLK